MDAVYRPSLSRLPTNVVNSSLTMLTVALVSRLCHWAAMQSSRARAGGCFLTLAIPLGFVLGLAVGDPLGGSLIGLVVGIALALVVWLLDRRRGTGLDDPSS